MFATTTQTAPATRSITSTRTTLYAAQPAATAKTGFWTDFLSILLRALGAMHT